MIEKTVPYVSKFVFALISAALALSALTLIVVHFLQVITAIISRTGVERPLIEAVEYVVIGLAIFDVSRFVMEEEVIKNTGRNSPLAIRQKITRFTLVIVVAFALEALLKVLGSSSVQQGTIIPAAFLLLVDAIVLMGLGVFIYLSVLAEKKQNENPEKRS